MAKKVKEVYVVIDVDNFGYNVKAFSTLKDAIVQATSMADGYGYTEIKSDNELCMFCSYDGDSFVAASKVDLDIS